MQETMFRLLSSLVLAAGIAAGSNPVWAARHFLYLSDQRIVTVELVDETTFVVNYINLSDSYEVLPAPDIVVTTPEGLLYRGHVFEEENAADPEHRYEVTQLIRPGEFRGFQVRGKLSTQAKDVFLRLGSRILRLEPLSPREFDLAASRINTINLAEQDRKLALQSAGFSRGYGEMRYAGDPDGEEWAGYFTDQEILPPVALATPAPRLPSFARDLTPPVVVQVRAFVTKAGALQGLELVQGLEPRLDSLALETVRNSWIFLPAVADNQLANAELKLNVVFEP